MSTIHIAPAERWSSLDGESFDASLWIVPEVNGDVVTFNVMMSHGLMLDDPRSCIESNELTARLLFGEATLEATAIDVPGNINETTDVVLKFACTDVRVWEGNFDLLLQIRGSSALIRWTGEVRSASE